MNNADNIIKNGINGIWKRASPCPTKSNSIVPSIMIERGSKY